MNFVYNRRHTERTTKNWATAEKRKKRKLCNDGSIRVNGYNRDRHNRQKVEVIEKLNYRDISSSGLSWSILTAQSQKRPKHMWVVDINKPPYTLSIIVNWIKTKFKLVSMTIKNYRGGKTAAKKRDLRNLGHICGIFPRFALFHFLLWVWSAMVINLGKADFSKVYDNLKVLWLVTDKNILHSFI